jgi:hypothetical protein
MKYGLLFASLTIASLARGADRQIPRPLPNHPGNVFLAGENVTLPLATNEAGDWKLVDYDGRTVREGKAAGHAIDCGRLPVGYYDLQIGHAPRHIGIGVIAPLRAPTSQDSPIGADTAAAWFYKTEPEWKSTANLASLAGLNWIRDRLSWRETELKRGEFVAHSKYDDTARIFHEAGLRILTVMHASPPWANPNPRRFPPDLRDISHFYAVWAKRLNGLVEAIEPWNEADWDHSGAEMASLQKACYLGIKAANPDMIVCQNVFATAYPNTVREFAANEAWPYFDTFNFHHYQPIGQYAELYGALRPISAGRPLWITECGTKDISWAGDAKAQEPDEKSLRLQAEFVPKMFAAGLYQGSSVMFYFILGHYVEGQTQFGLLRRDLTPRPGYLSLAAVGRLLAGAKPLGQIQDDQKNLRAFAFDALPDGNHRDVIVAWATQGDAELKLNEKPIAEADHLGRDLPVESQTIKVGHAPVFVILPQNAARKLKMIAVPKSPPRLDGHPSPIVLQAAFGEASLAPPPIFAEQVPAGSDESIPLVAYNFSDQPAHMTLNVQAFRGWDARVPEAIDLPPRGRVQIPMTLKCVFESPKMFHAVRVEASGANVGTAVLSFNVLPTTRPATKPAK